MLNNPALFLHDPKPPSLPKEIRYWDDFDDVFHVIFDLESDTWTVKHDGISSSLKFPILTPRPASFLKSVAAEIITSRNIKTFVVYIKSLKYVSPIILEEVLLSISTDDPTAFVSKWNARFRSDLGRDAARTVRFALHCACNWNYGAWRASDSSIVRALPGFSIDKYRAARDGTCFVPPMAQSQIVDFIDETARRAREREASRAELQLGAILALSFQYGLRRGQIARLSADDVVLHDEQTVHIRVQLLKQRGQARARTVVRSVQAGWTPIFLELLRERFGAKEKFFGRTPGEISSLVKNLADELTGTAYSASDFRHTAAQRLVDSGASREEVTDFLGHSDHTAADVYFAASPKQADLVDAALGKSTIYGKIAEVARTKSISVIDLASRPDDEQITGMPHGIPISGIGACTAGQSLCQRNPVVACYTCHKFLAVEDASVHQQVLSDLQGVVGQFDQPTRIDRVSPAMLQLRTTLEAVSVLASQTAQVAQ